MMGAGAGLRIGVGWPVGRAIAVVDNAMTAAIPIIGEIRVNVIQLTSSVSCGRDVYVYGPQLGYPN